MKKLYVTLLAVALLSVAQYLVAGPPPIPLPSQVGNSGKYLTTDGSVPSWAAATSSNIVVADTTDTTTWPILATDATGTVAPKTDGGLTYNAGTGTLSATVLLQGAVGVQPLDTFLTNIAALTPTTGCILLGGTADSASCYAMNSVSGYVLKSVASGAPSWTKAIQPLDGVGSIDNMTIGSTAPAAGTFTSLNAPRTVSTKSSGVTLTKAELCNGYIRATATETLTYPSITTDMIGCTTRFVVQGAYTLSIDVPGTVTTTLNGTAITAGNKISNSGFSGEEITVTIASTTSVEAGNPSGTWIDGGA